MEQLQSNIRSLDSLVVAYSGGVDSTFLLKVAHNLLGQRAVAVTARSATLPARELRSALDFTKAAGIKHVVFELDELAVEDFAANPPERCYICKQLVFGKIKEIARVQQIDEVADGSNDDDTNDYRPGLRALSELGIISPLRDAGFTKAEIRTLSRKMGLSAWDKPSQACLASRFPYGQRISRADLTRVDQAEQYLLGLGFKQVRVRYHGDLARIEVLPVERIRFTAEQLLEQVDQHFRQLGFVYTCLDLRGYRSGSLNEKVID